MAFVSAADAPVFTLPGLEFHGLTAPSRGAREICTWHLYVAPEYLDSEAHSLDREEVFVLLEGQLVVTVEGERTILTPGDAVAVQAGAQIQVSNPASVPAHALVCISTGFQRVMADGQPVGTPPWAQ
ncbi:MAG TPA: cupin domain-containing protein [Ktedonobacterales bacterium]